MDQLDFSDRKDKRKTVSRERHEEMYMPETPSKKMQEPEFIDELPTP